MVARRKKFVGNQLSQALLVDFLRVSLFGFSGNIIATLTVETRRVPFSSLEELLQTDYVLGVIGGSAWSDFFKVSTIVCISGWFLTCRSTGPQGTQ